MKNKKGNIYGRELFHKIEQQNLQKSTTLANHVSDIKHVKIASKKLYVFVCFKAGFGNFVGFVVRFHFKFKKIQF